MKKLVFASLLIGLGCATKQKSSWKETALSKTEVHQHAETNDSISSRKSLNIRESVNDVKWLKIYPKEVFSISEGSFVGKADSLVWYGNYQQQATKAVETSTQATSKRVVEKLNKETKSQQQKLHRLEKSSFPWWTIAALLCGLALCYLVFKGFRFYNFWRLF